MHIKFMSSILLIYFILIGCNSINDNQNYQLNKMINDNNNIQKYIRLYNIYRYSDDMFNYNYVYNRRASKDAWDEFTSLSKIKIHEINDDEAIKTWFNIPKRHEAINNKRTQILSGIAPDVIFIPRWEINFLARNKLVLPLTDYIGLLYEHIDNIYINEIIYGFMEPNHLVYSFQYDKNIIDILGLIDPVEQYKNANWNWDTFLELLLTVKNSIIDKFYDPFWAGQYHEIAFMASNGVEFIQVENDGKFIYSIDEKYLTVRNFLLDLNDRHKVLCSSYGNFESNSDILHSDERIVSFINKHYLCIVPFVSQSRLCQIISILSTSLPHQDTHNWM